MDSNYLRHVILEHLYRACVSITFMVLLTGCHRDMHEPICQSYVKLLTVDSITQIPIGNVEILGSYHNEEFTDENGVGYRSIEVVECDPDNPFFAYRMKFKAWKPPYYGEVEIGSESLQLFDTLDITIPMYEVGEVHVVLKDTVGFDQHCFDHFNFIDDRMNGWKTSALSDTAFTRYVKYQTPTRFILYTVVPVISSGELTIPLSSVASPWNYTIHQDTVLELQPYQSDTLELFY